MTLTNKADHDSVRVRRNGAGSYELVLKRLTRHAEHFNQYGTLLSVRFNANGMNASHMPEVYKLVKNLGIERTEFELYNTINYDYNEMVISLTDEQFKRLFLDLVKLKFEYGERITDFPKPTFTPCSAYTPYNLKVTAEGSLALCDAMHTPVSSLDHLLGSIEHYDELFATTVNHNPFDNPRCGTCPNIGICGGEYYCKPNPCDFLSYDLGDFLRFFADRYPETPELFEVE